MPGRLLPEAPAASSARLSFKRASRVSRTGRLGGAYDPLRASRGKIGSGACQFSIKPAFRHGPFALDGGRRDSERGCRLLDGQAAEEPQFDDAALIGVERFELLQRRVERDRVEYVERGFRRLQKRIAQFHVDGAAAMFLTQLAPRVIDENPPHQLSGDREEVSAVLPVHLSLGKQLDVSLVDDGGRLQAVVAPLACELPRGNGPKLLVDDGDQAVEGLTAPVFPLMQNPCDVGGRPRLPVHRPGELSTFWPCQSKATPQRRRTSFRSIVAMSCGSSSSSDPPARRPLARSSFSTS